jgi:hypothetical protein
MAYAYYAHHLMEIESRVVVIVGEPDFGCDATKPHNLIPFEQHQNMHKCLRKSFKDLTFYRAHNTTIHHSIPLSQCFPLPACTVI